MKARSRNERGFFTIWVLGLCICLFLLGGLSLDLWRGSSDRRELAAMTDAAAIAAASQIDLEAFQATPSVIKVDPEKARQRALEYLDTEAAVSGIELLDVQVDVQDQAVQVSATKELNLTLTRILRPTDKLRVTATSAAEPRLGE